MYCIIRNDGFKWLFGCFIAVIIAIQTAPSLPQSPSTPSIDFGACSRALSFDSKLAEKKNPFNNDKNHICSTKQGRFSESGHTTRRNAI